MNTLQFCSFCFILELNGELHHIWANYVGDLVNTFSAFLGGGGLGKYFVIIIFENIVQTICVLTSKYLYFQVHKSNVVLL